MKAFEFLNSQEIFYVLGSSKIKPKLSWKNKDQRYDVECKFCHAVYSDSILTNRFSDTRKPSAKEYIFLTCKNCGSTQTDSGKIYKKKTYKDYRDGEVEYPNKKFSMVNNKYETTKDIVFDEGLKDLQCYKSISLLKVEQQKLKKPNDIFLCVTDTLIASGLNPYGLEKRAALIEFYATVPNISKKDYIAFNAAFNKKKRDAEKAVVSNVNKSALIKHIAKEAQFDNKKDDFAVESLKDSYKAINEKPELYKDVKVTVKDNTILMERKDGCVKSGVINQEGDIIEDEEFLIPMEPGEPGDEEETLGLEELCILQSFINKTTGCKSELNVHEYLASVFQDYTPTGSECISGVVDGVNIYGFIDAVSGKEGEPPDVIIEIKKRMNQIFSVRELELKRYDLCQLILYKLLMKQKHSEVKNYKPAIFIVQSYGEDISIERIYRDLQESIFEQYQDGMKQFKKEIDEYLD